MTEPDYSTLDDKHKAAADFQKPIKDPFAAWIKADCPDEKPKRKSTPIDYKPEIKW